MCVTMVADVRNLQDQQYIVVVLTE